MNILEVLSVQIPCTPCGQFYEVPLNDILLSHQMLEQGCPVQDERECPPLFQTRLVDRDVLNDFVEAWSRLEDTVRRDNGELVVSGNREIQCLGSSTRLERTPQSEQITVDAKDRGLDETLSETFPCSDALSSIPDPPVEAAAE